MKLDRQTALLLVACVAIGYWLASPPSRPAPLEDRPVLRWITRAAKQLLWIAVFVEPAPAQANARQMVRAPVIGEDGYAVIDHGRGW